jgi:hypothetical protein
MTASVATAHPADRVNACMARDPAEQVEPIQPWIGLRLRHLVLRARGPGQMRFRKLRDEPALARRRKAVG